MENINDITSGASINSANTANAEKTNITYEDLSLEQKYAFMKFAKGNNVFITGSGGTGKSKLIQYMVRYMDANDKKYQVCAMTGCAAILLNVRASTIHSWSGIGIGKLPKEKIVYYLLKRPKYANHWRKTEILILDEVSMLSCHIFEMLDYVAKIMRKNGTPFGGMQLVFCGDFFQLPPIGNSADPKTAMFCFESPLWSKIFTPDNHIELKHIFRQNDPVYRDILENVRKGIVKEEHAAILRNRINAEYVEEHFNGCVPTKIFAIRSKVDHINNSHYAALENEERVYKTKIFTNCASYLETNKNLSFEEMNMANSLSKEQMEFEIDNLITNTARTQRNLFFKIGTVVMCTINYDLDNGICNGSQGIIVDYLQTISKYGVSDFNIVPIVKFANGVSVPIREHVWQCDEYPTIAIIQIPLTFAWAITIHKIQGTTLKLAEMDLGRSVFEYGQTYVALSRVQSLDGLFLTSFDPNKIKANPKVVSFYESFPLLSVDHMASCVQEEEEGKKREKTGDKKGMGDKKGEKETNCGIHASNGAETGTTKKIVLNDTSCGVDFSKYAFLEDGEGDGENATLRVVSSTKKIKF
jgi:ATP-dependent DNA helicase PIF1